MDVQSWSVYDCWTSHKYLWALKEEKKEEKNLQLSVNCSHFICSRWYFLFVLFFFRYSFFVVQCPCEYVPDVRSVCSFKHLLLHSCLSQRGFFFIIICCWSSGEMHILACIVHIHQKHTSLIYDGNIFLDRPCFYYYYSSYTVLPWWFRMRKTDNAIILLHSVVSHTLKKKKGGTEPPSLVRCALFLFASGVCDAVMCDSGHLIIKASVFTFSFLYVL